MKKIGLGLLVVVLLALSVYALNNTRKPVLNTAVKSAAPACFTMTPDKYPARADKNAPIVKVNFNLVPEQFYSEIQLLTRSERNELFTRLSSSDKGQLWIQHFKNYLNTHPDLNIFQIAYINETIILLSSKDYESLRGRVNGRKMTDRAVQLFGKEQAWELTEHLGGKYPYSDNKQAVRFSFGGSTGLLPPECTCTNGSGWCDRDYICLGGETNYPCTQTTWGCGWLMLDSCTGRCYFWP